MAHRLAGIWEEAEAHIHARRWGVISRVGYHITAANLINRHTGDIYRCPRTRDGYFFLLFMSLQSTHTTFKSAWQNFHLFAYPQTASRQGACDHGTKTGDGKY